MVSSAEQKIGQSTGKLAQPKGADALLLAEVNRLTTSPSLTEGAEVRCGDRSLVVRQALGSDAVLVEDPQTGSLWTEPRRLTILLFRRGVYGSRSYGLPRVRPRR